MVMPSTKILDAWGREVDQDTFWYFGQDTPPQENPDDTTSDEYYDMSLHPHVVAGMAYADMSQAFVSARGLKDKQTGNYYPPQLIWTTPELESQDIFDLVAWQFDEEFEGGFQEIIRSSDNFAKSYGYNILEYEWYVRDRNPFKGKAFVKKVYTRDREKYRFDQDGKPGIYKKNNAGKYELMNPQNFQSYAYNPLCNNPYGTSINLSLKPWIQTFNKVWGYWRHALEKAGMGSWLAYGRDSWFQGKNNDVGQAFITTLKEKLAAIAAGTYSVFPESSQVKNEKLQMEAQAFLDWINTFAEVVSLIHTGTTGALKEEKYGSLAKVESSDTREKSQRERFNAFRIDAFWTWKFIPNLCKLDFKPSQIRSTPSLRLIPANLMMPTTPKDQDTATEVMDETKQEQRKEKEKIEVTSKKNEETSEMMESTMSYRERYGDQMANMAEAYIEEIRKEHPEYFEPQDDGEDSFLLTKPSKEDMQYQKDWEKRFQKTFKKAWELQENEKEKYTPPQAIPATYQDFPSTKALPNDYKEIVEGAQAYLEVMPVKGYYELQPEDAYKTFTVKRLRRFEKIEELLQELKLAIIPTLGNTEHTAWELYWQQAIKIFQEYGFERPSSELRNDLIISFRQARQNALNEGYYQSALSDPDVVGLRIVNDPNVKQHHTIHIFWNGIAIPKDHPELALGGRLRIPMDFGCVCGYEKVYLAEELTPESEWPKAYPGDSYKYYATSQPKKEI